MIAQTVIRTRVRTISVNPQCVRVVQEFGKSIERQVPNSCPAMLRVDDMVFGLVAPGLVTCEVNLNDIPELRQRTICVAAFGISYFGRRPVAYRANPGSKFPIRQNLLTCNTASADLERICQANDTLNVTHRPSAIASPRLK